MEIADLNLIADFEAGIKCLQNPSLISKLSSLDKIPKLYSFWTFTALIIAVFATFTNTFNKIKLFIHQIRLKFLNSCQNSYPERIFDDDDFDFDFSDDDDQDFDTPSSVAESDNEDHELDSEDDESNRVGAVFRAEGLDCWGNDEGYDGNFTLRRRNRFSWSDFSAGKSVVQLWDSFGLGLDFEDDEYDYKGKIGILDLNLNRDLCQIPAAAENSGACTEICASWRPRRRNWVVCDGDGGVKEE
ncbi:hypothetical protein QVD17_21023 [Tagetes erecta]|uniref:Uncharacterized protein n=1 Tax=Tagetes erecta TaxID=13708 RepID=A0AAD8KMS0_TARER|nr:hypothetical protein QVD17_21023 [Tagetes erecta]